ncbi:class I SAM-dependent methyltransferase [Actinophytocola algeriensis]|uniref:SAM-dependent methyltransferase n=1 Tax=Actinophytocola algeriensis TaxID=1768010 RepID=A0A7W7Q318_9PSEU|nr:class I SAM-dependent methyltransferase [Actinophytocola algeriensis]MBB4906022.1 SAM-dependent methyltransferase [Actinophytocola algeriensis]MBE1472293.1 SAM-dependent methyltransferase [Actinophytocola algeriensis]
MHFDTTGKVSFEHVYTEPDPRPYFAALREFDYQLPQLAKPYFAELIAGCQQPTVLDVGCSYGVNAALYRFDTTMDELYEHYANAEAAGMDRAELIAGDRARVAHDQVGGVRFIGLDTSAPALEYARAAGFIDVAIHADLERDVPTEQQSALLAEADLVVSTGCVGYVTERTIARVADLPGGRRPVMAHFVLRMFSYEPIAKSLADLGYETVGVEGLFKQRRFVSEQEQAQILDAVGATGAEPHDLETEGWLCAQLYLSRPMETIERTETRG